MRIISVVILVASLAAALAQAASASATDLVSWNPQKAANYLDHRIEWWMAWPATARSHGTFCVSCHTALPYALARPRLRESLGEAALSVQEKALLGSVTRRVRLWKDVQPFYVDLTDGQGTTARARGTEAVLNALILASCEARGGVLSDDARAAFENMWELQRTTGEQVGSWWWLQFGNEPFEAHDSQYYGAGLAAVAAAAAPESYRSAPRIQKHLSLLRDYLNREYPRQSSINHVVLLWASVNWPGLIQPERRRAILDEIVATQHTDGGWNLASLTWTWRDWSLRSLVKMFARSYGTPLVGESDGYATALIAFVLAQAGVHRSDPLLKRALAWLVRKQNPREGFWLSYSLNNRRDPSSPTGRFMSDAATAFAVLALSRD